MPSDDDDSGETKERRVSFERDMRLRYFDFLPIHMGEVREANATLRRRFHRG